jgi:hypothetical protein
LKGHKSFLQLINDEKLLNFPNYDIRLKKEKYFITKAKNKSKEKEARKVANKA